MQKKKNLNNTKKITKAKVKKKHETQNDNSYHFFESYNDQVSRGYNTAKAERFRGFEMKNIKKQIGKKESENRQ